MSVDSTQAGAARSSRRTFITGTASVAGALGGLAALAPSGVAAQSNGYFPGFKRGRAKTSGAEINYVIGGSGPPVLLLHGYPQTHCTWHKVAPLLASEYTVVVADLRGYGDSSKPASTDDHAPYSKRAMALDQVELMKQLGFERFAVVGHDRGGRVAHRMALDHPGAVTKLSLLDIVPGAEVYQATDRVLATGYYHWFFLIQAAPMPEKLIAGDVDAFLKWGMARLMPKVIEPAAYAEYLRCLSDPAAIHAMCEDYRAGASIDLDHDAVDAIKTPIACPTYVVYGVKGLVGRKFDVPAIWRKYAARLTFKGIETNHWIPEEAPQELVADLKAFLKSA